jgi:hypothetical protein
MAGSSNFKSNLNFCARHRNMEQRASYSVNVVPSSGPVIVELGLHLRRLDHLRTAGHKPGHCKQQHGEKFGQRGQRVPQRLFVSLRGVVYGRGREALSDQQEKHERCKDENAVALPE